MVIEEEEAEDAYWAKYAGGGGAAGGAVSGPVTRNASVANFDHLRVDDDNDKSSSIQSSLHQDRTADGQRGERDNASGRVMCDMPTTGSGQLDPLAALLATIPDRLGRGTGANEEDESGGRAGSPRREAMDLRDKVQSRIKASLREVWNLYTRETEPRAESLEEKAHGWLRLGRAVVDSTQSQSTRDTGYASTDDLIVIAKLEVLKDMWTVIADSSDDRDGFWRCVEGAIKMSMLPENAGEGMTQETYWE